MNKNTRSLAPFSGGFDQLLNRFFNSDFGLTLGGDFATNIPAVNLIENEDNFVLDVAAPGIPKENLKLSVEDNIIRVYSSNESSVEVKEGDYLRREFNYSSFSRSFNIPDSVAAQDIVAKYNEGVLRITLPKTNAEISRSKEISIS